VETAKLVRNSWGWYGVSILGKGEGGDGEKSTSRSASVWLSQRFCVLGRILDGGRIGRFSMFDMLAN
jgi:hypothetical protein